MKLAEAHCHLDKCHTADRLTPGDSLLQAIAAQEADKDRWTADDLRTRGERGLKELAATGCNFVRTHVDCRLDPTRPEAMPLAWEVLGELAQEWRSRLVLQRAALFPIESFADPTATARLAVRIARDGGALGAFVLDQSKRREGIQAMVRAATEAGIPLDFHVDEGFGAGRDGLAIIAETVREHRFSLPVLCGHASSMIDLEGDALTRRLDLVSEAGLTLVSLPTSNLYLQDRNGGTPNRRGLSRVKEALAYGIPVAFGSDNVRDAFVPFGTHDPIRALFVGALAAHLDPPFGRWLACVTRFARLGTCGASVSIENCQIDDLLLWPVASTSELVSAATRPIPIAEILQPVL
ncbi:amidohydrolase family protein [Microvirga sp. WGZ8]|uniref:Amidohydrolase family protein n=2 Tax=Microvirga puerhi TaxID=2876078 RepID=A0ABS7VT01_9HYPH|nr:amidohydrolase family protein [Microvirga puerhi]